tara:strand:- start:1513 stop:1617 length:105 start_codon:yes stop_codon:yes gene_type:complete
MISDSKLVSGAIKSMMKKLISIGAAGLTEETFLP